MRTRDGRYDETWQTSARRSVATMYVSAIAIGVPSLELPTRASREGDEREDPRRFFAFDGRRPNHTLPHDADERVTCHGTSRDRVHARSRARSNAPAAASPSTNPHHAPRAP